MITTIKQGNGWEIVENVVMDEIWLTVVAPAARYVATNGTCDVLLTPEVIDAIRAIQPRFLPHLRQQRSAIFSERSKKGWQTRRNEGRAQQDADIKTLINMEG